MRNELIARARSLLPVIATAATALFLGGCCCPKQGGGGAGVLPVCPDNVKRGVPIITCQPVDTDASPGTTAMLYTEALGESLQYQWFVFDVPNQKWVPKTGGTAPTLTISPVSKTDYGLYYCQITANNNTVGQVISRTREAALGGSISGGTGGTFVPVQFPTASGGSASVCVPPQTVSGSYVRFYPPTQTPDTGKTSFSGGVFTTGATPTALDTSTYVLQWFVTGSNWGCCNISNGSTVTCPATPGLVYRFTVYFKFVPATGTVYELRGSWN